MPVDADTVLCTACHDILAAEALGFTPTERAIDGASVISVLLPYHERCRAVVHALKYHGIPSLGPVMGRLMAVKTLRYTSIPQSAVVVPVPLHPDRFRERGYNQSEKLAGGFSAYSGLPVDTGLLKRPRYTQTQTRLSPAERAANVADAFIYTGEHTLDGREAVIIDDVLTTGSTIAACVRALKDGGAGRIVISVLATPEPGGE
jgi:ComF family protein